MGAAMAFYVRDDSNILSRPWEAALEAAVSMCFPELDED